jgi:hypothetical protein
LRRSSRTTTAYTYAETLTLEVNPANGAMEVLRGAAIGAKVAEFRKRPTAEDAVQVLPFSAAELVDLGINPDIAAEAIRLTSDDRVLDLAADLPEWRQLVLVRRNRLGGLVHEYMQVA